MGTPSPPAPASSWSATPKTTPTSFSTRVLSAAWEGCEAFDQLKIGTKLELVREEDNAFDPYAVAIYYNDYKLGFIPRAHNHDISKYLDMGLHDIYEVRITRLTPDVQPEQQVEVIVNILNQK